MKKVLFSLVAIAAVAVGCTKPNTPDAPIKGDFVKLDKTSVTIVEGETATLVATYEPESLTLTWSSSDEAVATVDNGVVTAVAEGTAVITVKAGVAEAKCNVTVEAKPVTGPTTGMMLTYKNAYNTDFASEAHVTAEAWTVEIKFRKDGDWHTGKEESPMLSNRLITVGDAKEQGVMLRFNNGDEVRKGTGDWAIMDVCSCCTSEFYCGKKNTESGEPEEGTFQFMKDTWYTLSFVGGGDKLYVYVNGELIKEQTAQPTAFNLQRIDLGMSWTDGGEHNSLSGYPVRQSFDGTLAYVRMWSKALTEAEIKANLCEVEENSANLECNIVFDAAEGHIAYDKTNKGHDLDFSNMYWVRGYSAEPIVRVDASSEVQWVEAIADMCE